MKLDPVINQEPKEQLVPTFNKKEIEELIEKKIAESGSSGGTQLYQHIIELEVTSEGEPKTATLRLINTSPASLADKRWGQLIPYISATIYGIWDETPVVSIINEQDETRIICYDQWGNQQELRPNWDGEYGGFTGPDTVTAL